MSFYRESRPDIKALRSIQNIYELADGQAFYETPKAFEIWHKEPLYRVARLPRKMIVLVFTND